MEEILFPSAALLIQSIMIYNCIFAFIHAHARVFFFHDDSFLFTFPFVKTMDQKIQAHQALLRQAEAAAPMHTLMQSPMVQEFVFNK